MGPLSTYDALKRAGYTDPRDFTSDGWGFTAEQVRRNKAAAQQQPQPQQQMPQVDTSNAIQSIAQLMGPTPAEREAQEQRLLKNKRKMIAWTGLFDGLRHLGNLYYASKGATPQQYTDQPYKTIEQNYQQERQLQDYANRYSQAYAKQLFDWQRQADQDQMRREAHEAQNRYTKAREDALREDSRRKDEYNLARTKYYEAVANKNDEQAEYWRLRAQGVPQESAAKIAKDNALAAKANRTTRSGSQDGYETIVTEGYDNAGNKVKKTVKQPRKNSSSSGNSKKTYDNTRKLGL